MGSSLSLHPLPAELGADITLPRRADIARAIWCALVTAGTSVSAGTSAFGVWKISGSDAATVDFAGVPFA